MNHKILARLIAVFLLLLPFLPGRSAWAAGKNSPIILSTSHKHAPGGKLSQQKTTSAASRQVLVVTRSDTKQRPSNEKRIAARTPLPRFSARSAIIIDAATGAVIFSRDADRPAQPASTIKVLTGLLAIDALKNTDLVPVSHRAASMPRSKVYLRQGRSYRATDLINAVLLASANDASVALAEKIAGSEGAFAQRMTRLAGELGARRTVCKTASGLTAKGQHTTARDLATLFSKAMLNKEFAHRMKRTKASTSFGTQLRNHNRALWQISGSEGGKTGYTWAARQTYVGKFKRHGREIVLAIMGSRTMWDDIKHLVEYGFAQQPMTVADNQAKRPPHEEPPPDRAALTILTDTKKTSLASL